MMNEAVAIAAAMNKHEKRIPVLRPAESNTPAKMLPTTPLNWNMAQNYIQSNPMQISSDVMH
jgi:hypothetical protein